MKIHPIPHAITYDLILPILCLNGDNSSSKNYFKNACLFVVRFLIVIQRLCINLFYY